MRKMKASPIRPDHLSQPSYGQWVLQKAAFWTSFWEKRGQKSNFLHFFLHDWRLIQSQTPSLAGFAGPHAKLIGQLVFLADLQSVTQTLLPQCSWLRPCSSSSWWIKVSLNLIGFDLRLVQDPFHTFLYLFLTFWGLVPVQDDWCVQAFPRNCFRLVAWGLKRLYSGILRSA